ncbi:MAG TPA: hypothetical protein VGH29_04780 [Candidatus Binataceae bacterium]|jgi:hypothetical protein
MTNPVDPLCRELAQYFLDKIQYSDEMDVQELAEAIQKLCEEYCRPLELDS